MAFEGMATITPVAQYYYPDYHYYHPYYWSPYQEYQYPHGYYYYPPAICCPYCGKKLDPHTCGE